MPQDIALKAAVRILLSGYKEKIANFSYNDFLKTGVDPFRFKMNCSIFGLKNSIRKEIEHKLEMALENLIGDFHENYLGNCIHLPSNSKWEKVPNGVLPGVDIKNSKLNCFLQIKSKHNSMNSSSSAKLAEQIKELIKRDPGINAGCAWIIAWKDKNCIGEKEVKKVGIALKGKSSYAYVTGNDKKMDEVLAALPTTINKIKSELGIDVEGLIDKATNRILEDLTREAKRSGIDVETLIYKLSVD